MANANKPRPNFETLTTSGVVTCNSRDRVKILALSGNVTDLQAPIGAYPGDRFQFHITLNSNTIALNADYVSGLTTPPTILENTVMDVLVMDDGTVKYWLAETGA